MRKIRQGDEITLMSFNGTKVSPSGVLQENDYWQLIGMSGCVESIIPDKGIESGRVLIRFFTKLDELNLANHNTIKNSLWILEQDIAPKKNS